MRLLVKMSRLIAALRERFARPAARGFKELLASCPLEGVDLARPRDFGRDIEF